MINKLSFRVVTLILLVICMGGQPAVVGADPELPLLGENGSINLKKEIALGSGLYNKLKENGYVIDDPMISRYLQDVGDSLLSSLELRVRDYYFYLVKDGSINAFAAPGGYIGVNLGLIGITKSEDELASVLAHEISHVELMHSMQMIERAQTLSLANVISMLAAILVSGQDIEAATAILYTGLAGSTQSMINFTRANEYEADRVGVEVLKKSEYDPQAMVDFMQLLQSREQAGELSGIEYLRTHPVNSNRIAEITSRISGIPKKRPKITRYQQFKDYLFYLYPDKQWSQTQSRFSLALEYTRNGRYVDAEKIYNELIESDPDSLWFNYALAENMEYQQRLSEASLLYQSTLLLYPEDIAIAARLVTVMLAQDLPGNALKIAMQLYEKHKDDPTIYQLLADVYSDLNDDLLRQLAEANYHWYNGNKKQAEIQYKALLSRGGLDAANEESMKEKLGSY